MSDRLQEINARLSDAMGDGSAMPWQHDDPGECVRSVNGREIASVPFYDERDFIAHAPADIAWLLDEVEETRHRLACAAIDAAGEVAVSSDDREWHLARYGVTPEEAEKASDRRYQESRERGSRNA